jgi:hypothetical protein
MAQLAVRQVKAFYCGKVLTNLPSWVNSGQINSVSQVARFKQKKKSQIYKRTLFPYHVCKIVSLLLHMFSTFLIILN